MCFYIINYNDRGVYPQAPEASRMSTQFIMNVLHQTKSVTRSARVYNSYNRLSFHLLLS